MSKRRTPLLGYYLIATDAKETEVNYLTGLKDSIPAEHKSKITIRVIDKVKPTELVKTVLEKASEHAQYAEPWIVFDRDRVPNFDAIIREAEDKGVKVGWSNPCIEIWFYAYYGDMPSYTESTSCVSGFRQQFQRKTKLEYEKSKKDIYRKLVDTGDEKKAIELAKMRLRHGEDKKPSEMYSTTTLHELIEEIRNKTK